MVEENLTSVFTIEMELKENGDLRLPNEKVSELFERGFRKVNVVLFGSSENAVAVKGLDNSLFRKIRNLQSLPDTVVLDFISVKGVLKESNIKSRIEF